MKNHFPGGEHKVGEMLLPQGSHQKSSKTEKYQRLIFQKKYQVSHKLTHQVLSIDFWIFEVDEVFKFGLDIPSLNNYPFPKPIFSIISKIQ